MGSKNVANQMKREQKIKLLETLISGRKSLEDLAEKKLTIYIDQPGTTFKINGKPVNEETFWSESEMLFQKESKMKVTAKIVD